MRARFPKPMRIGNPSALQEPSRTSKSMPDPPYTEERSWSALVCDIILISRGLGSMKWVNEAGHGAWGQFGSAKGGRDGVAGAGCLRSAVGSRSSLQSRLSPPSGRLLRGSWRSGGRSEPRIGAPCPELPVASAVNAGTQAEAPVGSVPGPVHAAQLQRRTDGRHTTLLASRTFPRSSRLSASIRSTGFLFQWPGTPVARADWNRCSNLPTAAGDSCQRNGRLRPIGATSAGAYLCGTAGWLRMLTIVDALLQRLQAVEERHDAPTPSIPKQLSLPGCQAPDPAVPDWESLNETVRSAVLAALAQRIERVAAANGEGRAHELTGSNSTLAASPHYPPTRLRSSDRDCPERRSGVQYEAIVRDFRPGFLRKWRRKKRSGTHYE